jgi:hypothetical protein
VVSFRAAEGESSASSGPTNAEGRYEVAGLEPASYSVTVAGTGLSYETEAVVSESGALDIDVSAAALSGRTVDTHTRAPVSGVEVTLWRLGAGENRPAHTATTNASGEFVVASLREGRYRGVTAKNGYGQQLRELELARDAPAELLFELAPAEGLNVRVVDARDGSPLDAIVVVRDSARRIVANRHSGLRDDGSLTIALAPGPYLLSTSANSYGTVTLPVTAPGREVRVGLTPGGTLVVESTNDLHGRIRL